MGCLLMGLVCRNYTKAPIQAMGVSWVQGTVAPSHYLPINLPGLRCLQGEDKCLTLHLHCRLGANICSKLPLGQGSHTLNGDYNQGLINLAQTMCLLLNMQKRRTCFSKLTVDIGFALHCIGGVGWARGPPFG